MIKLEDFFKCCRGTRSYHAGGNHRAMIIDPQSTFWTGFSKEFLSKEIAVITAYSNEIRVRL